MGAQASTEAVILESISKNDPRKLREAFADRNPPTPRSALALLRPLSQPALDRVHNPESKPSANLPTPFAKYLGLSPLHIVASLRDTRLLAEVISQVTTLDASEFAAPDAASLRADAPWSVRDTAGLTALSSAVRAGNVAAVSLLLDAGADPDEPHCTSDDEKGISSSWSHLRYCAAHGIPNVLQLLLERGADNDSWGKDGRRPIHLAVEAGQLSCVKHLLQSDAEPGARPDKSQANGKRIRAVGKYIVRDCTMPHNSEPADAGIAAAVSEVQTTAAGDVAVAEPESRHDILNALQVALQDAVRGLVVPPTATRGAPYRSNRDRGASLLHLACSHSHPEILSYLLSLEEFSGAIEEMNDSGKSAIFMAIRHGSLECLELLVKAGARIDAKDIENWTALHEAVKAGDERVEILNYLIDKCGSDVIAVDDDGWTPLHVAARFSSSKAVDILVNAGCSVDAKTEDNETAVLLASAQASSAEVLRKLLENGADLSIHRDTALTPSRLILGRKDFNQLCILFDHLGTLDERSRREVVDLESRSETGDTLLHLCVLEKNVEATTKLLAIGAKPDVKNHDGIAALHTVCKNGPAEIAKALLEATADPNAVRADGMMPVHIACDSGHPEVVEVLIQHGCDVNRTVSQPGRYRGFSPLMFAARLGDGEITSMVIQAGAELNLKKGDGFTALHLAALNGNTVACKHLIKAGADYRIPDETGYFPLQLATRHNQFEVVSTLLEADVEVDSCGKLGLTSLHIASFICDARLIWLLLRGGADVNAVNSDNATPLHVAAGREQGRVTMQLLMANEAKLDVIDSEQDTPLHNACYKGLYQNVRLLLRRGAAPSPVNESNVTPLHLAAAVGSEETVEALLKYGADVEARDNNNKTPYKVASEHNHRKAMVLLFRSMTISLQEIAPTATFGNDNPASSADEILCVICQSSLIGGDETRTLPCYHTYHNACIMAWLGGEDLTRHDSCPLCQKSVLPESSSPRQPL